MMTLNLQQDVTNLPVKEFANEYLYDESEFLKSTYHKKLMKQDFYKKITIRNGNTFEKIAEILENEK